MKRKGGESEEKEDQKWVRDDACVDYKGRVPLRAATAVGKASLFVIG